MSRGVLRNAPKVAVDVQKWMASNPIRLWRERQDPHVSRVELGRRARCSYQAVANWEQGITYPFGGSLQGLIDATGDKDIGQKLWDWREGGKAA